MTTKLCPVCQSPIPPNAPGGLCPVCVLRDAEEPVGVGGAAPSLEEIAVAFPQLEVLELIGQGGMGFVYKARQPGLDRIVALKILSPELGRDPAFAERFAREARVLGKLHHPNIVTVFEHGVSQLSTLNSQPFYYLLMEYVDGVNLRQAMRAGRFTPEQALAIVPGICDALQFAHEQGVWHRDIKPENILLDARGGVKMADFGIARLVGDPRRDFTLTLTGGVLGSAAYMAPEQHENPRDVDHRADIYSLGVVIYEMLTGELPLGRFPAPSRRAAVNARIDEIVLKTLEKERELRQQSATEVKTEVRDADHLPARKASNVEAPDRLSGLSRWMVALLIGGGLLAGMGAWVADSFRNIQVTGMMTLLIAVGGAVSAAGFLGLLWVIFERKLGGRKSTQRHARSKAGSHNDHGGTPNFVPWAMGQLIGGGLLAGMAAWVADSFRNMEVTSKMALLIAVGGAVSAAGLVSLLWILLERRWRRALRQPTAVKSFSHPPKTGEVPGAVNRRKLAFGLIGIFVAGGVLAGMLVLRSHKVDVASDLDRLNAGSDPTVPSYESGARSAEAGKESWAYRLRHQSLESIRSSEGWNQLARTGLTDGVVLNAHGDTLTVSGPPVRVRRLATLIRMFDRYGNSETFFGEALTQSPEVIAFAGIPFLMTVENFDQMSLTAALRSRLEKEGITAIQLARALSGHVLEVEKASFDNAGLTLDEAQKNPQAQVVTKGVIPCADQPNRPLVFEIHYRKNPNPGVTILSEFESFSPWLIMEAKRQSKKRFLAPKVPPPEARPETNAGVPSTLEARLKDIESYATSPQRKILWYRAICRIEVQLEKGDTVALLNEALGKFCTVLPVSGVKNQFDLMTLDSDPAAASRQANYLGENAEKLLQEREVKGTVRIVQRAERPEKPVEGMEGVRVPNSR